MTKTFESDWLEALTAVARATNYSLHAHVPQQAILAKFRNSGRERLKRKLRKLAHAGFIVLHPTAGETTWQLTRLGLKSLRESLATEPIDR
jgi:hypothetical protein